VATFLIAELGILGGDLDLIAPIITMFFMVTYGYLNLATFKESYTRVGDALMVVGEHVVLRQREGQAQAEHRPRRRRARAPCRPRVAGIPAGAYARWTRLLRLPPHPRLTVRRIPSLLPALVALVASPALPAQQAQGPPANFAQAERYSSSYLSQRTYSTSVEPRWIGETDRFWYSYRTAAGTRYYLVDPRARTKAPLFDHVRLASRLSVEVKQPLDADNLGLSRERLDDEGARLSFVVKDTRFELELATGALVNKGPVPKEERERPGRGRPTRAGATEGEDAPEDPRQHRDFAPDRTAYVFIEGHDLYYVEASAWVKAKIAAIDARLAEERREKEQAGDTVDVEQVEEVEELEEGGAQAPQAAEPEPDPVDERELWADDVDETKALRLTDDGEEDYEFSSGRRFRRGAAFELDEDAYERLQAGNFEAFQDEEQVDGVQEAGAPAKRKTRPRVSWAPDSSAFYVTRRDSRGVEQLFLVNSLSQPRPTLETYDYPMPGEVRVGSNELHVFDRARKQLFRVAAKWKDESYLDLHWARAPERAEDETQEPDAAALAGSGDELRMLRRDRLLRNVELCSIDTRTGGCEALFEEGFMEAYLAPQSVRYLRDRGEMIWWSERSGWAHFYLYDKGGAFKHAITSGPFRASRIVEVDQEKGILYFLGNGREPGENVYLQHLYRVFLDGTGLTLMDPGDANHRSVLSPTRAFLVDNCSRVDMTPVSRVCDADGHEVMKLEEADLSRLYEAGWRMPETFTVKAADGVTDLYGNMWKPFDFDPEQKYPIIAEVYPGPQTEGVSHSFSASNGRQQLAQIGFIVVQLGHRGGTPGRSKAYHSYGYFNMRDYGLEDKRAGLEQLAERHPYIDIERVGLFGHSGGGFMTAAALLREPYNEFFKVGVASSGNHDNNVYGWTWAERYHGLKEVQVEKEQKGRGRGAVTQRGGQREGSAQGGETRGADGQQEQKQDEEQDKEQKKVGDEEQQQKEVETRFEIHVPTNAELAANLKGHLLLVHGDMDNNVHPAGTMRLVDALMKANKRFDMLIIPGKRHGFGDYTEYFNLRRWEYFAEHLLGARRAGADIK
jgi:dipeptidyl aminopeptidase/acylaminoacyl peptidase